jgi:HEAT repeat protein
LLPGLLSLPIPIVDSAGELRPLRAALDAAHAVTITGAPGSGRGLVMHQYALYLGRSRRGRVTKLVLPQLDAARTPPEEALAESQGQLLLVRGWEELPVERRDTWRFALQSAAERGGRVVVALPQYEPAWPRFVPLVVIPPPVPLVARWLALLASPGDCDRIAAAVAPDGPLASCADRLLDLALLAWAAPRHGIPATRGELYALALREMPDAEHPQTTRFTLARQIAAEGTARLAGLAAPDLTEVATLAAELAPTPDAVLRELWRLRGREDAALAFGRCVRESRASNSIWVLRAITVLGRVVAGGGSLAHEARRLIEACLPALDSALDALAPRRGGRLVRAALRALPRDLALERLERLVYDEASDVGVGWLLADTLTELTPDDQAPPPTWPETRSRWIFVQALRGTRGRQQLAGHEDLIGTLLRGGAGAERLMRVGRVLLGDPASDEPARLAAVEMLETSGTPAALEALRQASERSSGTVRRRALAALDRLAPEAATASLERAAHDPGSPWDVRLDALLSLAASTNGMMELLVAARDSALPLFARVRLVRALWAAGRAGDLLRLVADVRQSLALRCAAAAMLAELPVSWPGLPALLAREGISANLRLALCRGIAAAPPTQEPQRGTATLAQALLHVLRNSGNDPLVCLAATQSLGRLGDPGATETLVALLGPAALEHLLRAVPPALVEATPARCLADPALPAGLRLQLTTALARAMTPADQPTTLRELLIAEANRLRAAAAQALGRIGGASAVAALRAALACDSATEATAAAADALAEVAGGRALIERLAAAEVGGSVRWQIVERLAAREGETAVLAEALADTSLDPFTRGALASALGRMRYTPAFSRLLWLAEDQHGDAHLREQAIGALGALGVESSEALLEMACDRRVGERLRGLAAEHLPQPLELAQRRTLRELIRGDAPEPLLVAGVLRALGRAKDREALGLALRYALDDRPEVVRAAVAALAGIGDDSVTPALVRLSQRPSTDTGLRIAAVGALLRLGGREYHALIQPYLNHNSLLVQLQALDALIGSGAVDEELAAMLATGRGALPLRLRLIERLAGSPAATTMLEAIVTSRTEVPQARRLAAEALGTGGSAALVEALDAAESDDGLRLRCIEALARAGTPAAWEALSRVAEEATEIHVRAWASAALGV